MPSGQSVSGHGCASARAQRTKNNGESIIRVRFMALSPFISFSGCLVERKRGRIRRVKRCWRTVRDNLQKAGWNCCCISSTDHKGRQFWVMAAEREDAGRFIVHADQMLTALRELESVICTDSVRRRRSEV